MFGLTKYLYIALLACALVAFAGWQGYKVGKDRTNALWLAKQAAENAAAAQRINELQNEARAKESLAVVQLSNIQNELSEAQNEIENDQSAINKLYADIARLRFGLNSMQASGSTEGTVAATTRECDGETVTEFSGELFEAIYSEFGKCDKIVEQLTAAQAVIEADRETVNK